MRQRSEIEMISFLPVPLVVVVDSMQLYRYGELEPTRLVKFLAMSPIFQLKYRLTLLATSRNSRDYFPRPDNRRVVVIFLIGCIAVWDIWLKAGVQLIIFRHL
jgi:hypothetical protein